VEAWTAFPPARSAARGRPRLWHHDYLHLRPLLDSLRERLQAVPEGARVLDLGCGASPYRLLAPASCRWVRVDLALSAGPDVVARAEALPLRDSAFDVVLSTQILGLVDDPRQVGREVARVLRPGGVALVSAPAARPYDAAAVEHRHGVRELPGLFPGLRVREVRLLGGMLGLPFALLNVGVREAVRSAERRLPPLALLRAPAAALFVLSNLAGRGLERLAGAGPLAAFLGYLDRRLPSNLLLIGEKP
jgi:SAM-dependent methyltransferase